MIYLSSFFFLFMPPPPHCHDIYYLFLPAYNVLNVFSSFFFVFLSNLRIFNWLIYISKHIVRFFIFIISLSVFNDRNFVLPLLFVDDFYPLTNEYQCGYFLILKPFFNIHIYIYIFWQWNGRVIDLFFLFLKLIDILQK
jgi:hypothetical protein